MRTASTPTRRVVAWCLAVTGPPALAAGLLPLRGSLNLVSDALLFLVVSVIVAALGGLAPSLVTAVEGALLLNFFFTVPFHTLTIEDPNNAIALIVFMGVAATVSVAVDLVARHRDRLDVAEANELALKQANDLRTALLAAVGHDLRSPLAAAKASISGMLSPELDLSPSDRRELLETADEAVDQLAALVANLLDMSRLQTGSLSIDLEPSDIGETVSRARMDVDAPTVRVLLADNLPPVLADPGLLERILANVLANAVRFSPADIPPRVHAEPVGSMVQVRVIDHGPGVPAAQMDGIFAAFQRMGDNDPSTGLGLGLALSRGLAEAMHGKLWAEATPGGGLTVVLSLKRAETPEIGEPGSRERENRPT